MKNTLSPVRLAVVALVLAPAACAAAESPSFRWHLEAGPSLWLKSRVTYGATGATDPSAAPRSDRFYDDGFNRVDASGNLGDGSAGPLASRTGYFGYTSDSQVDLKAGTLALHRSQLADGPYFSADAKSKQPAWHATVRVSLRREPKADRDWGLEAGVDVAALKQNSTGPLSANIRILTDTYLLGGVVPQRAPYAGRFSPLPGDQRIGDAPTRSIATTVGTLTGQRSLSVRTTALHLGPWYEFGQARAAQGAPERERWALRVRGGVALLSSRVTFASSDQVAGTPATVNAAGERTRSDLGAFAGLTVRRAFTPRIALLAGADALWGSRLTVAQGNRYARLDLTNPVIIKLGIEIGFGNR